MTAGCDCGRLSRGPAGNEWAVFAGDTLRSPPTRNRRRSTVHARASCTVLARQHRPGRDDPGRGLSRRGRAPVRARSFRLSAWGAGPVLGRHAITGPATNVARASVVGSDRDHVPGCCPHPHLRAAGIGHKYPARAAGERLGLRGISGRSRPMERALPEEMVKRAASGTSASPGPSEAPAAHLRRRACSRVIREAEEVKPRVGLGGARGLSRIHAQQHPPSRQAGAAGDPNPAACPLQIPGWPSANGSRRRRCCPGEGRGSLDI